MNPSIFYNRVVAHELYACQNDPTINLHKLVKFTCFTVTITPRQQSLSRLIILSAVLQIIFNKKAVVKFIFLKGAKKICAFSQFSKSSRLLDLKDNLFNFVFFKQPKSIAYVGFDTKCTFFFNTHTLMFNTFVQYYRFVFNIPRLRISLQISSPEIVKIRVFARLLRIPLL